MRPVALRVHLVHWHVLRFMLRQRGGAGCGRAALAAAGLLLPLARMATCGPPRLRPGHRPVACPSACAWAWALLLLPLARTATCGPPLGGLPSTRHVGGLRIGFGFAVLVYVGRALRSVVRP